ncbi:hypothetical protein RYX36_031681 [Vicia faba]
MGSPIYSAKSVRFKMGHLKASLDDLTDAFVWTYTSPEFPMAQLGADVISSDEPLLCVDDLADQVAEVLDFFGLREVMCMGVTVGAYILTLFAMKYKERVLGLILVSPICKGPSWTKWIYNKVLMNLLYFYGMCGLLKEFLLQRYFSKELRCSIEGSESEVILTCRRVRKTLFFPQKMPN